MIVGTSIAVGCGGDGDAVAADDPNAPPADRWSVVRVDPEAPYLPTLANADVSAGPVRLSFTIQDREGHIRGDLEVRARLYDLESDPETPVLDQFARFISFEGAPLPQAHTHAEEASLSDAARNVGAGVYVVPGFFAQAGLWGVEFLIAPTDGGESQVALFRLQVRERSVAPAVGDAAPMASSRTLSDEPDLRRLTSDSTPEPGLYQLSIDEALARGRPLIVAFATPAYCHSRTCGPTVEIVKLVWRDYADWIDAIHVEVFENPDDPERLREAQAFLDWDLPSEPWVFVIDAEGKVFSRYEGTVTEAELRGDMRTLLGE